MVATLSWTQLLTMSLSMLFSDGFWNKTIKARCLKTIYLSMCVPYSSSFGSLSFFVNEWVRFTYSRPFLRVRAPEYVSLLYHKGLPTDGFISCIQCSAVFTATWCRKMHLFIHFTYCNTSMSVWLCVRFNLFRFFWFKTLRRYCDDISSLNVAHDWNK